MRYKFFQYPRGVNKGGVLNTEICPTISTSSWENNCFLIEIDETERDIRPLVQFKGKHIDPYESFYWNTTQEFFRGQLGGGISRTVKTDDSLAVMEDINNNGCIQVGNIYPDSENMVNRSGGRVNSTKGCAPTILSRDFKQPKMIMEEVKIAAMRERNPDNPNERGRSNGNYQQRLEINENGMSNTLTSVQKDNLVIEPTEDTATTICLNSKVDGKQPSVADRIYDTNGIAVALTSGWKQNIAEVQQVGTTKETEWNRQQYRVYGINGLSPCLNCCGGGGLEPKVVVDWQTVLGSKQHNSYIGSTDECSSCITSACGAGGGMTPMLTDAPLETAKTKEFFEQVRGHEPMRYRIRKLTPRECFRLMDVDEDVIDKIQAAGISNSQQYKLAGNSIVVACLEKILEQMFFPQYTNSRTLFG